MGAPEDNKNAAKDSEERAESFLHIRARRADKARWVRAAQRAGKKLSDWVTELLNANS
jgi:predicted HicB family RNase H-like nuclease